MKKQANPESSLGPKELEDGSLDWITPNYDLHIEMPEKGNVAYTVFVFDSSKEGDEGWVEAQEFDFWYEVLEYIECWN